MKVKSNVDHVAMLAALGQTVIDAVRETGALKVKRRRLYKRRKAKAKGERKARTPRKAATTNPTNGSVTTESIQ